MVRKVVKRKTSDEGLRIRKLVNGLLTHKDLVKAFGCKLVTIHHWRHYKKLPHVAIEGDGRNVIRYIKEEVIAWANDTGRKYNLKRLER